MSGFAGMVQLPDHSVTTEDRTAISQALQARGPGQLSHWASSDAALFHLHTGQGCPQHTFDEASDIIVVGDIRIDNRTDIRRELGLSDIDTPGDARLLAVAWKVWGTELSKKLCGDFAFAIVDRQGNRAFLVRDALGVRPLFWKQTETGIAFASDARSLASDAPEITDDHVFAYLTGAPHCPENTQYAGVRRLQAGHSLEWISGDTTTKQYWRLDLTEHRPPDPEQTFRDLFQQAVTDRLTADDTTAAMLSGGLDSSSICVMANRSDKAPLRTYSLTYPDQPDADESPFIDAVLASDTFDPVRLPMNDCPPLDAIDAILKRQGGPYEAPGLSKSTRLFNRVASDGYTVLLSGHGGDEVVWTGVTRVNELAHNGHFIRALPLIPAFARASGQSSAAVLVALLRTYGRPNPTLSRILGKLARRMRADPKTYQAPIQDTYLDAGFAERTTRQSKTGLEEKPQKHLDRAYHIATLTSPLVQRAFEILDTEAAAAGIELRYPFYDRRLVEFCVALPACEKFQRGQTRSIMRRALRDVLPAKIFRRKGKVNFAGEMGRRMVRYHDDVLRDVSQDSTGGLRDIVNLPAVNRIIASMRSDPTALGGRDIMFLWRVASLHIWLTMIKRPERGERQ